MIYKMDDKTEKVRNQLYLNGVWNALSEVSMYAYLRGCPGLSDAECRELEELVDKASGGIVKYLLESEEKQTENEGGLIRKEDVLKALCNPPCEDCFPGGCVFYERINNILESEEEQEPSRESEEGAEQ